jgi:serine/threonine protein kinase
MGPGTSGMIAGYRLGEYVSQGAAAVVRLARDERQDRTVAIKILGPELAGDDAFTSALLRTSRTAGTLGHPHVLPVYEAGEAGGTVYVAMHYAAGGDARSLLSRLGPLPVAWAWGVIAQAGAALDAAHARGLVHGDVKPANLLLEAHGGALPGGTGGALPSGTGGRGFGHVYVSDFGMSRAASPGEIIATGPLAAGLDYLAPEQIEGDAFGGAADLYALACTGFELLCGTPPFGRDQGLTVLYAQLYAPPPPAAERRPDLPAAVDEVLARALAKDPADRYPTCREFAEELRVALGIPAGVGPSRRPETGPGTPTAGPDQDPDGQSRRGGVRPRRFSGVKLLVLAVVVVALAAAVTGVALLGGPRPGPLAATSPAAVSAPPASPAPASPPPATPALASQQAVAVSNLLASSAAARRALQRGVSQARSCTELSSAVSVIQGVVNQRSAEYDQASALPVSALPDGATLKADLLAVLRDSLAADRDYLTWARQLQSGCVPGAESSAYLAVYRADQTAGPAKAAFTQVWNPVAARYGIRPVSPGSI